MRAQGRGKNNRNRAFAIVLACLLIGCFFIYIASKPSHHSDNISLLLFKNDVNCNSYGVEIKYIENGDDSISYNLIFELDSLKWVSMKNSGEEMYLEVMTITDNMKLSRWEAGYLKISVEETANPEEMSPLHKDLDKKIYSYKVYANMHDTHKGFVKLVFSANLFGEKNRYFSSHLYFLHSIMDPESVKKRINRASPFNMIASFPKHIDIKTTPSPSQRSMDGSLYFGEEHEREATYYGMFIEGRIPKYEYRYDLIAFILGTLLGAVMSGFVTLAYEWTKKRRSRIAYRQKAPPSA